MRIWRKVKESNPCRVSGTHVFKTGWRPSHRNLPRSLSDSRTAFLRLLGPSAKPKIFHREPPALMRTLGAYVPCLIILALTGCASNAPIIQIERVNVPQYLPIPAELTRPCDLHLNAGTTYGEALGLYDAALKTCQAQIQAITDLKPPMEPY